MLSYCCCAVMLMCGACAGKSKSENQTTTSVQPTEAVAERINTIKMVSPKKGDPIPFEDTYTVVLSYPNTAIPDSVKIFIDGKEQVIERGEGPVFLLKHNGKVGDVTLRAEAFFNGKISTATNRVII